MYKSIIAGFCIGLTIGIINHNLLVRAFNNLSSKGTNEVKRKVNGRIIIRYFLIFVVLYVVHKDATMLIAAAVGLTMVKNYLFLKNILRKKGVN